MHISLRKAGSPKVYAQKILVEAGQPKSNQLALSIFLPTLEEVLEASTIFYDYGSSHFFTKLKAKCRQYLSPIQRLSTAALVYIQRPHYPSSRVEALADQYQTSIVTPELLEQMKYRDILIGDLIYDTYLRRTNLPTIELQSSVYREILTEAINLVDFWIDYFADESIAAVCVSHCVYLGAIPARVGVNLGRLVFQVNTHSIYKVTSDFPHAYTDFVNYKEEFLKLPRMIRDSGLARAKERLALRFRGEVGVDMHYSTKSAYSQVSESIGTGIIQNKRLKVLIAIHDFYDSPHAFGNNFYPDFYIWLCRLNELSYKTDYDWYIKTHPDIRGDGAAVLEEFIMQSNDFRLLPSDTSHHDLIEDGVDCVLTVFGTIAMEYPYLGKTVINASRSNPHVNYSFSVTPKDKFHYEEVILNLKQYCSIKINREEILEYYFMHNLQALQSWVFLDQEKLLDEIGGYDRSNSSRVYSYFLGSQNRRERVDYERAITAFLKSNEIRISRNHFK